MADGGQSQRAAAMAAFNAAANKSADEPAAASGNLTARQLAMQNFNKQGLVSSREVAGMKGESQHAQAMRNLAIDEQPKGKVVPNWKQTTAQKNAYAFKKEMGEGPSSARKMFQDKQADAPQASPVPVNASRPPMVYQSAAKAAAPSAPAAGEGGVVSSGSATGPGAAEAEEGVTHDLNVLVAGIKRLVTDGKGSVDEDGGWLTTFGAVVDDEELEQVLESLVGTLKAGRKRGVLEWKGQLLLKGPNDNEPIKLMPGN